MLHMYALVRHPAALPDIGGIDEAPLRSAAAAEGIDAVVTDTNAEAGAPTEAAILAHAEVVEAVAAANDSVLPARFAGGVPNEDELRRRLDGRRESILEALGRVEGCIELGLRVLPDTREEPSQPASGSEYMRRRLDEIARAAPAPVRRSWQKGSRSSCSGSWSGCGSSWSGRRFGGWKAGL